MTVLRNVLTDSTALMQSPWTTWDIWNVVNRKGTGVKSQSWIKFQSIRTYQSRLYYIEGVVFDGLGWRISITWAFPQTTGPEGLMPTLQVGPGTWGRTEVAKAEGWRKGEAGGTQRVRRKRDFGMPTLWKGLCMGDRPALSASLSSLNCKFVVDF